MATMPASFVGSDIWNAEVYGTLSVASRTSAAIKGAHHLLKTRWFFIQLNLKLDSLLDAFYTPIKQAQRGEFAPPLEQVTPEQIQMALDSLWDLQHALQVLYDLSVRKGLKNKVILKAQMQSLAVRKEKLLDVIQWISEMSNPEEILAVDSLFDSASEELKRGETVTIS